jgi:hypothetical protein
MWDFPSRISHHGSRSGIHMPATDRALMSTQPGGPEALRVGDLPVAPPRPGQLRLRVRAAGGGAHPLTISIVRI